MSDFDTEAVRDGIDRAQDALAFALHHLDSSDVDSLTAALWELGGAVTLAEGARDVLGALAVRRFGQAAVGRALGMTRQHVYRRWGGKRG